jgi:hypothetical protein
MVVRMEDFNRENITSYGVPTVSRVNNVNQNQIQRRQPDVKIVQSHLKEPIKIVQINKEPIRNETPPVRTIAPPVRNDNTPVRTINPPVNTDNVPLRSDPPVRNDNSPVRTITPPVVNNNVPLRTDPQGRNDIPPVRTNAPPVVNKNTTTVRSPNNRNIIHMQVPPEEKQKVDRYQPKVVKDVLIKKSPRPVINNVPKSDVRNNNDKKVGDEKK